MHEQQSSNLSATSEEDLVYQNETPMGSFEIGYGSVLIRHPNSKSIEEESEASSIPVNNKSYNTDEAYSGSATYPVHSESKGANVSLNAGSEKAKKCLAQAAQENAKRCLSFVVILRITLHRSRCNWDIFFFVCSSRNCCVWLRLSVCV